MCKTCGVSAAEEELVKCAVCGATEFDVITPDIIQNIIDAEGGSEDEPTYDGRKLKWTKEARRSIQLIKDNYQKRRAKARIEKSARMKRMATVTAEFA